MASKCRNFKVSAVGQQDDPEGNQERLLYIHCVTFATAGPGTAGPAGPATAGPATAGPATAGPATACPAAAGPPC